MVINDLWSHLYVKIINEQKATRGMACILVIPATVVVYTIYF